MAKQKNSQRSVKKLRIAMVHPQLIFEGGADRQLLLLANHAQDRGHEVTVFTRQADSDNCFPRLSKRLKFVTLDVDLDKRSPIINYVLKYSLDFIRMASLLKKHGPFDIIYTEDDPSHWSAALAKRSTGSKILWMCNDPPYWIPSSNQALAIKESSRRFGTAGGMFARWPFSVLRNIHSYILSWSDRLFAKRVDLVTTLDEPNKSVMDKWYGKHSIVAWMGIETHKFIDAKGKSIRKRLNLQDDEFMVLCVGLFMPHRHFEDVVEAMRILDEPKAKLVIVGSDRLNKPYFDFIKKKVEDIGLGDHVMFTHYVPDGDLPKYYAACDAFVFPNVNQTWGLVVLEAMAAARPVIVSRGAGIKEVLRDGKTALLVDPKSPDQIAEKLKKIINDPHFADKMAREGRKDTVSRLDDKTFADKIIGLFEQLAKGD